MQHATSVVQRLSALVAVTLPGSYVELFGSTCTGLAIPGSDIDLLVCTPSSGTTVVPQLQPRPVRMWYFMCSPRSLALPDAPVMDLSRLQEEVETLAAAVTAQSWVDSDSVTSVASAAVPVIKLADASTDPVHVDLTFRSPLHKGHSTTQLAVRLLTAMPPLAPLVLALKQVHTMASDGCAALVACLLAYKVTCPAPSPLHLQLLFERGLNDPYTGGIGSYALLLVVTNFLQQQPWQVAAVAPPPTLPTAPGATAGATSAAGAEPSAWAGQQATAAASGTAAGSGTALKRTASAPVIPLGGAVAVAAAAGGPSTASAAFPALSTVLSENGADSGASGAGEAGDKAAAAAAATAAAATLPQAQAPALVPPSPVLGQLLLRLLRFLGKEFDPRTTGMSVTRG